jgi:hypothetical protein
VFTFDLQNREVTTRAVATVSQNWTGRLATVEVSNTQLSATRMHAVWVESNSSWTATRGMWPGMTLRTLAGDAITVSGVHVVDVECTTYNFEVEDTRCYFVGERGILVHNGPKPSVFADNATRLPTKIYKVIETKVVNGIEVDVAIYGGKTVDPLKTRFQGHLNEKPAWKRKFEAGKLRIELVTEGEWTAFETAVWEKHTIEKLRKDNPKIENIENPISEANFDKYRERHVPCK